MQSRKTQFQLTIKTNTMKHFLVLFFISLSSLSAQNYLPVPGEEENCITCPPILAGTPPPGEIQWNGLDRATAVADLIGKANKDLDCSKSNAPWNCNLGKWLTDLLPCMYHPSTPQGSLCGDDDEPGDDEPTQPNPEEPNPEEPTPNPDAPAPPAPPAPDKDVPQNEHLYVNPSTKVYAWSWGTSQSKKVNAAFTRTSLVKDVSKMKNGSILGSNKYGYKLLKHSAYYTDENKKNIILFMTLKNKKGQTLGNPTIVTTDKKVYLVDMASKTKKWPKS